jgi:hypothetical protein
VNKYRIYRASGAIVTIVTLVVASGAGNKF